MIFCALYTYHYSGSDGYQVNFNKNKSDMITFLHHGCNACGIVFIPFGVSEETQKKDQIAVPYSGPSETLQENEQFGCVMAIYNWVSSAYTCDMRQHLAFR